MVFLQRRFAVEKIDVGWASGLKEIDDTFGLGRVVRRPETGRGCLFAKKGAEGYSTKRVADTTKKGASVEEVGDIPYVMHDDLVPGDSFGKVE